MNKAQAQARARAQARAQAQTQALEATSPRINATVSASAGTGKTWLLVARLQRLLLDGATPASILAITFTQKAAAEIRERLTSALREWTQIDDEALNAKLTAIGASPKQAVRARALYETLIYADNDIRILTFHAFCMEILKRFPFEARVPPGFEICDEAWALQEEALNQLYIEAANDGAGDDESNIAHALQTLFEICDGLDNTSLALRNFLSHRNDWLSYVDSAASGSPDGSPGGTPADAPNNIKGPVQYAIQQLSELLGVQPEEAEHGITLDDETRKLLETHARLVSLHQNDTNRKYAAAITEFFDSGAEINEETLPPLFYCFFKKNDEPRESGFTSKAFAKSLGEALDEFTAGRISLTEKFATLKSVTLKRRAFRRNRAWYTAGHRLAAIYEALKLARRQLDFDDLEWLACRLVNREDDAQWIQYRLNERIRHVLVDEFQDTNPQQWRLLQPLLEEMAAQADAGSAFIVGDIKQSIYGFRRASPELQDAAGQWLKQHMGGQFYTTDLSRRSSPRLIEFVNRVFGGPIDQADEADEADAVGEAGENSDQIHSIPSDLPDFRQHDTDLDTPGNVIFLPFVVKQKTQEEPSEWREILRDPPAPAGDPPAREEAEQIAECITQMMNDRVAVHDRDGNVRPLRWGDITLLLRSRTRLDYYEHALIKAGIPHGSGRTERLFGSQEIADMLALLEFLINHERNLDLAQVLRSPIFAVSDEQLITLAQARGDNWFARLAQLQDDDVLRRAHELLGDWIEAARVRLPAHDLLDRVYREGDVIRRYRLTAPDGEENLVEKNLLELLDYSLEFDSGRYPDVAHFARQLKRRVSRARHSHATVSASGEPDDLDRLRILTIHQAKGLEAPVVILADCGKQRKIPDAHGVLADWPAHGERPEHFLLVPKIGHMDEVTTDCKQRLDASETKEAANRLYVALTRARQYLLISGGGEDETADWYGLLKSHAPPVQKAAPMWETLSDVPASDVPKSDAQEVSDADILSKRPPLPESIALEMRPNTLVPATSGPGPSRANDDGGQLRGEVIHYALKLLSEDVHADEAQEDLAETMAAHFPQALAQLREWIESARELIADPLLRDLFDNSRYEQALNEVPVSFAHNGERYFGIIDRVCVGREAIWLVDYKTHASPGERAEALKLHYTEQMRAYYLAVSKLWPGRTVRVSLLLTENRQLCDYDFDTGKAAE